MRCEIIGETIHNTKQLQGESGVLKLLVREMRDEK
jgi:hypothetical protein